MTMRQTTDQLLQAVLDALPAHIAVLDQHGAIMAVNAAWRRFTQANGYAGSGSGLGLKYLDICGQAVGIEPADARSVELGIRAVLAGEQVEFRYDYTCQGPDEPRWCTMRAVRLAGDQPLGAIVTHEIVTQRQQSDPLQPRSEKTDPAVSELAATSSWLQALFDRAQDAFLLADDQGRYIDANTAACELAGYSRSELLRLSIVDLTPIAARGNLAMAWTTYVERGIRAGEFVLLRKDGSYVLVEFYAVARIAPGVHLSVLRDITARRQAEDGLRQHVERLSSLHAVDQHILAAGSLEEVGQSALTAIHQLVPYRRGSLIVFDFELGELRLVAVSQNGVPLETPARQLLIAQIPEAAMMLPALRRGEQYVFDLQDMVSSWSEAQDLLAHGMRYQICTPLTIHGELFGSLQLVTDTLEAFAAQYMPIVHEVVGSLAIALRQALLFEQVHEGRERLRDLARRLVAAQEQERRQLARDLHDQVGQSLAALNVNLSLVRNQLSSDSATRVGMRLLEAIAIVDQTVDQIRNVMADLRPAILDDYGLVAALRWYTRYFARQTDLAVLLEIEEPPSAPRLPADLETALFRIAQEALTNVVKHAHATLATLTLTFHGQRIQMAISDDGVGFDANAVRRPNKRLSLGLMTIQERVEAIGGRLLIDAAPGQGTRIVVDLAG
jgi:PAS domain S-box-containing protein